MYLINRQYLYGKCLKAVMIIYLHAGNIVVQ